MAQKVLSENVRREKLSRSYENIIKTMDKRFRIPDTVCRFHKPPYSDFDFADTKTQASNTTKFPLASISKLFTAIAILQLVDENALSLNDSVCKFFPNLPPSWEKIKIRHLITHTSGIALSGGEAAHRKEYLNTLGSRPLNFEPGERMEYNNPAYILLGWIIEKQRSEPLREVFGERIFRPLEMNDTSIPEESFVDYIQGYTEKKNELSQVERKLDFQTMGGTAGVVSTVEDLSKFAEALCQGKLLSPKSYSEFFQPHLLNSNKPAGTASCWRIEKGYASRVYQKNGNISSHSSWLAIDPKEKSYLIILSNKGGIKFDDTSRQFFNSH